MEWVFLPVGIVFVLLAAACLVLVVIGLPGSWIMLALAGVVELADAVYLPEGEAQTFSWWLLGACVTVVLLGDLFEFLAGAAGAKAGGGTKRGMWGAIIGGVLGLIIFTPLFAFLPVIGSLLGALLGTFVGAYVGEVTGRDGTNLGSIRPAAGATLGRVLGTLGKAGAAVAVWGALSLAAVVP
jgi:uncharacterized protein YqgC (DUF456 family)